MSTFIQQACKYAFMRNETDLEIFLVCIPGLEAALRKEAIEKGFKKPKISTGGVTIWGGWSVAWRANLELRGASKVLVRLGSFRVQHLSKLDKLARRFPWSDFLLKDVPIRIDVTSTKSKIYHEKAAAERFEKAIKETIGARVGEDAVVCLKIRIYEDTCTISIDTSGEGLHKRGHKEALHKASMRETMAALLLRQCGYEGNEPVVDPMCGSGTFILEAAEIAAKLKAGRTRSFAFEQMANFDPDLWMRMKDKSKEIKPDLHFYGSDRDEGAIKLSTANAERAGVDHITTFKQRVMSDLTPPCEDKGLVIINPPYGVRIGETKKLTPLYKAMGETLKSNFTGWRVGIVTSADGLAKATGLPFEDSPLPINHGGIKIKLYQTKPLP